MSTTDQRRRRGARFAVGIDLGTTNSALAYVDFLDPTPTPKVLMVPQWEAPGTLVEAETLPSFYYFAPKAEAKRGSLALPFEPSPAENEPIDFAVGRYARAQSTATPQRVVSSAKSWLCHGGVSREEPILPWHSDEIIGGSRRSPVEISAAYLRHLKLAWNHAMAETTEEYRLENQDVVITVPASFDEASQRLTLKAAKMAGLEHIRLLEEPQAAFYWWLAAGGRDRLGEMLPVLAERPARVLVCDIGGGTTDFSYFEISRDPEPEIKRLAVSEHLLLGGDNIDLSLAYLLEPRLAGEGKRLTSRQWAELLSQVRSLKEAALSTEDATAPANGEWHVSVTGEGASLFAGTLSASLGRAEIIEHILHGFLPFVGKDEKPRRSRIGLTELGLPYAQDTAMTRHLAGFLAGRPVDGILFTGGTCKPEFLRRRIASQIADWEGREPQILENDKMDLAVALGAAAFGKTLRQDGARIRGGYPRSLYVEVAHADAEGVSLLCLIPKGFEPGQEVRLEGVDLKAVTERPVRFQLYSSTRREGDRTGDVVSLEEGGFYPLPSLHTKLEMAPGSQKKLPQRQIDVRLEAALTETGLLELRCLHEPPGEEPRRWQLEFNARVAREEERHTQLGDAGKPTGLRFGEAHLAEARRRIAELYGKKKSDEPGNPKRLMKDLEKTFGLPRQEWDSGLLRALWPDLEEGMTRRGRSPGHESTWLYLAGFALRPGYGYELDEWRVAELSRVYDMGMVHAKDPQVQEQWWILWRRVAGGLSALMQEKIFDKIFPVLRKGKEASAEQYMLAGSLERVDMAKKIKLGNFLVDQIVAGDRQNLDQKIWALGRMASRVPLYGGPETVIRPRFVSEWVDRLGKLGGSAPSRLAIFYSQAGRLVGDREFDVSDQTREEILRRLEGADPELSRVVREHVPVDQAARARLFGESLPSGLILT